MKIQLNKPHPNGLAPEMLSLGIDDAIELVHASLADHQIEKQTVALLDHLTDRLRMAEDNQAALIGVLRAIANDSTSSREALLAAIGDISERLAEAPQVNVTVPVPDVNVTIEPSAPRRIEFERDAQGRIMVAEEVDDQFDEQEHSS